MDGRHEVVACVRTPGPGGKRRQKKTRTFTTFTASLEAMADWFTEHGVTEVVMEATGSYWKPVWYVLEDRGFDQKLVNIGITLLGVVGAVALRGRDHHRHHPLTAAAYGSGAALIIDEAALLIDLKDVYWANDGRKSVDVAIGVIALGGVYLAAVPFWRTAARELTHPAGS